MILITGATSGIGEATARALAERKQDLFLVARRTERLEALAIELRRQHSIQCETFTLDVSQRIAIESFGQAHRETLKKVRGLINNAGLAQGMTLFQDGDLDAWDTMIDTNVKGLLAMTRLLIPHFVAAKSGHIINLGSVAGSNAYSKGNIYCATKAAVHMLTQCLRQDLNGTGIRVTEISPGMVETEFSEVRLGDRDRAKAVYAGMTPLTARDIAEAIVWCMDRPSHVNIQDLVIYPTDQASPILTHRRS